MRKILFRAKHKEWDEWVEGDLIHEPFGDCIQFIKNECRSKIKVKTETICQYTGLADKNGRKIWENDIVSGIAYSSNFVGYIVWIDEIAGFGVRYHNRHREPTAWENSSILKAIQRWNKPNEFQAEVIGNIFDNPELIKD